MYSVRKNFVFNSIFQIFSIIVPLITTPYLSRVLGVSGIGEYSYAYSIADYFSLFITLGLVNYGSRTIAMRRNSPEKIGETFWNIYSMQLFFGIVVSGVYFTFLNVWKNSTNLNIIVFGVLLSACFDITWFFYGMEDFVSTSIRDILIKIITIICIFLFVKENTDVWKYTAIRSIGFVVSQLIMWPRLFEEVGFVKPCIKDVLKHVKPNLILFIPTIAVSIYKTMDKIMLGTMTNEIEVGYYESCEKVIFVPLAIITALGTVMMPHMTKLRKSENYSNQDYIEIIRKSEHFLTIVSATLAFGIMAVAAEFVPLFYGDGFEKCVTLFYILLPSCVFLSFANVIRTQYLIPNEHDKEFIISLFLGAFTNVLLNIILIPVWQSIGAAVGTLMAEFVVCISQIMFVSKYIPIFKILRECSAYVIASVIMFILGLNLVLSGQNMILNFAVKVLVCGFAWGVILVAYYLITVKFFPESELVKVWKFRTTKE